MRLGHVDFPLQNFQLGCLRQHFFEWGTRKVAVEVGLADPAFGQVKDGWLRQILRGDVVKATKSLARPLHRPGGDLRKGSNIVGVDLVAAHEADEVVG